MRFLGTLASCCLMEHKKDVGWIPVIHKHSKQRGNFNPGKHSLITLFVDNLPEDTSQPWLKMLFNKYGVVKDVFIPEKRSKSTGNRFGFIRYDCPVSADLAVLRTNGIWLDDKKLFVKLASFEAKRNRSFLSNSIREGEIHKARMGHPKNHDSRANVAFQNHSSLHKNGNTTQGLSFAQVLRGAEETFLQNKFQSKQIQATGTGWLYRSAVAKLSKLISTEELEKIFKSVDISFEKIKAMGGRFIVITFLSQEARDTIIKDRWMLNWFEEINPWSGEAAKEERFAWLSCYGMPLNGWSNPTFKLIGDEWGHFLKVDDSTLKEISYERGRILIATEHCHKIKGNINLVIIGKQYNVRVEEDESFRILKSNFTLVTPLVAENQAPLENIVVAVGKDRPIEMEALKVVVENVESNNLPLTNVGVVGNHITEEVTNALVVESDGDINDVNSNSPHGLDSLVGLESLVVKSIAQPFQGWIATEVVSNFHMLVEDIEVEEKSPSIDCSVVEETMEEVADSMKNVADPLEVLVDDDDCTTIDLASDDPLFKYVDLKRQRTKNPTKQEVRRKYIWTKNPLKAAVFSRTFSRDHKEKKLKTFKLGLKKGSNSKAPYSLSKNESLSLGDDRLSDFGPNLLSQEGGNRMGNRVEKEFSVSLARAKTLDVNLLPGDEALLKELLEEDSH